MPRFRRLPLRAPQCKLLKLTFTERSPIFGAIEDQQRAFRAHNALQGMLCAVLIGKSEREDKPI